MIWYDILYIYTHLSTIYRWCSPWKSPYFLVHFPDTSRLRAISACNTAAWRMPSAPLAKPWSCGSRGRPGATSEPMIGQCMEDSAWWNLLWTPHRKPEKTHRTAVWVFPKIGIPQNGWFTMEHPTKMDDLGVPLFQETSILISLCE